MQEVQLSVRILEDSAIDTHRDLASTIASPFFLVLFLTET